MPSFGVALAWIIISPFAFLTDCLAVVFILHYRPLYHSCDVAFISLFITMATNAWLLLPIPAVMELAGFYWSKDLCRFYTWLATTLRSSHLLVLLVVNVYWMASLRVSPKNNLFMSSKPIAVSVCVCWFISFVIGLIPAADIANVFHYYEDNMCKFLPANCSRGFAIIFIIVPLVSTAMGVISSLDTLLLFRAMKEAALTNYSADRFHVPTISGGIRTSALIHAKYNELNVSIELCRLVLLFSVASSVFNALPLLASQFVQLIQVYSREALETTLMWLVLLESLLLPHLLWWLCRRYRHAANYTWRVFVLRDRSAVEEDTASCSLQAFRFNVKNMTSRPYTNGGITTRHANGTVHGPGIEDHDAESSRNHINNTLHSRPNGVLHAEHPSGPGNGVREHPALSRRTEDCQILPRPTESTELVLLHETRHRQTGPSRKQIDDFNNVTETPLSLHEKTMSGNSFLHGLTADIHQVTDTDHIQAIPPSDKLNISPIKSAAVKPGTVAHQIKRSVSASSRLEWKERMMKKHLPAVFLTSSVEDESDTDLTPASVSHTKDSSKPDEPSGIEIVSSVTARRRDTMSHVAANWTSTESTYYLSGDYHYDYLNDTLIRSHPEVGDEIGESSARYVDEDINVILDNSLTSDNSVSVTDNCDNNLINRENNDQNVLMLIASETNLSRKMDNIKLPSAEITQEVTSHQVNSMGSNDEKSSTSGLNVHDSRENSLLQNKSKNLSDNKILEGSCATQSVSQPSAKIISISASQPSIRVSNYRKFLAYTDLIISDVDNPAENDDNVSERDNRPQNVYSVERYAASSSQQPAKENIPTSISSMEAKNDLKMSPERSQVKKQWGPTFDDDDDDDEVEDSDCIQDYSKCQTVSGSEMLRLKMKSIRAATAMNLSDDTTSEDGGIDNTGYNETSNDESDDNPDSSSHLVNPRVHASLQECNNNRGDNNTRRDINTTLSQDLNLTPSRNIIPSLSTYAVRVDGNDDDDTFQGNRLERDGIADGEESCSNSHPSATPIASAVVSQFDQRREDSTETASVSCKTETPASSKLPISVNSTRTTSSNVSTTASRKQTTSLSSNMGSQLKSRLITTSASTKMSNIVDNLHKTEDGYMHSNSVDSLQPGEEEKYAGPLLQDELQNKKYYGHTSSGKNVVTSNFEDHVFRQDTTTSSDISINSNHAFRQVTCIPKPPRHRKQANDLSLMAHKIESNLNSEYTDSGDKTNTGNIIKPHSTSITNASPLEANMATELDISDVTDTDSAGSDLSVTLEPYGQRQPIWMNDVLLSSFSNEPTTYKKARELFNLEEESTDFVSNLHGDIPSQVHFGSVNTLNDNNMTLLSRNNNIYTFPAQQAYSMMLPRQINDDSDIEDDDENGLDYLTQSNFYRNRNLYFEAIKEEPEDLLSDSASSFDHSEIAITNVLRDTPITSRVSPNYGNTGNPISSVSNHDLVLSQLHLHNQHDSNTSRTHHQFPTSERTSADGSESVPQPHISNCLSSSQTSGSLSIPATSRNQPHLKQKSETSRGRDPSLKADVNSREKDLLFGADVQKDVSSASLVSKHTQQRHIATPPLTTQDNSHSTLTLMDSSSRQQDRDAGPGFRTGNSLFDSEDARDTTTEVRSSLFPPRPAASAASSGSTAAERWSMYF